MHKLCQPAVRAGHRQGTCACMDGLHCINRHCINRHCIKCASSQYMHAIVKGGTCKCTSGLHCINRHCIREGMKCVILQCVQAAMEECAAAWLGRQSRHRQGALVAGCCPPPDKQCCMPKLHVRCFDAWKVNAQDTLWMISIAAEVCGLIAPRQGPAASRTGAGLPPDCRRGAVCAGQRDPLPGPQIQLRLHPAAHRRQDIQGGGSQCAACLPDACQPLPCRPSQLAVQLRGQRTEHGAAHSDPSTSSVHAHDTHEKDPSCLKPFAIQAHSPMSSCKQVVVHPTLRSASYHSLLPDRWRGRQPLCSSGWQLPS